MSIRFFWYADVLHIDQVRKGCENMAVSRKKRAGRALMWAFLFLSGVVVWDQIQTWQEEKALWQTEASTSSAGNDTVLLGGMPVGIYMETDGVMVLNTEKVEGIDGEEHEPAADVVETGDYITAVDHHAISGKADLLDAVGQIDGGDIVLTLRRGEETMDRKISPIEYERGSTGLGSGSGTMSRALARSRFSRNRADSAPSDTGSVIQTPICS